MSDDIDRARVEAMYERMMVIMRDNYLAGPTSRDRVFEALNALAVCAGITIAETGDWETRQQTREYLDATITQQVIAIVSNPLRRPN